MEKKKSIEINVLGWAIIISTFIIVWCDYCSSIYKEEMIKPKLPIMILHNSISNIAVFPSGLPWIFATFKATPSLLYSSVLLWSFLIVICGIGILKLNNMARIGLIILSLIQILTFVFGRLLMRYCQLLCSEKLTHSVSLEYPIDILPSNFCILN